MRSFAVIKLTASVLVLAGAAAFAQAPTKIGIINLEQAIVSTQEGQAALARVQREFVEPHTKKLEAMQAEIKELQDKLNRGGNTMSQTAKDDMTKEINRRTTAFNRAVEDYEFEAQEEQRKTLDDLTTKMRVVVRDYVSKNNFAAVFDTANSGLVWAADTLDITRAIIEAYDQANPVSSSPPAAAKPTAPGTPAAAKPAAPGTPAPPPADAKPGTPAPAKP
jgi:outer membrane protein